MRIFSIVGVLITTVIIGLMAAMYFKTATSPVTSIPEAPAPYETAGSSPNPANVIDTAREIASMDLERQQDMQNMLNRMGGANTTP